MKIVILDAYTCNPGDLNWDKLAKLGELSVYHRSAPEDVISRAVSAEIVLTNKTILNAETLRALPNAKYIGLLSTGTNVVDLEVARELGIVVTNIPAYSTAGVAQIVFGFILSLMNHVDAHSRAVHEGAWVNSQDFSFTVGSIGEMAGMTMGLVGYGAIGKAVSKIALGFGMNVLVQTRTVPVEPVEGVTFVGLDELLAQSDIVSLHCPLNDATNEMINSASIAKMKDGAILINTGRGGLIHEADVAEALNRGKLGGAGVDVLSTEPPKANNPMLTAKNCVITPHIAWASKAARTRLIDIATNNLKAFIANAPINIVN